MSLSFNRTDFENVFHSVIMVNQTSGTECKDIKILKVLSFSDTSIVLRAPFKSCSVNHHLMVCFLPGQKPKIPRFLSREAKDPEIVFSAIGKVSTKRELEDKSLCDINLAFSQYDKKQWGSIIGKYQAKQADIKELFNRISFS